MATISSLIAQLRERFPITEEKPADESTAEVITANREDALFLDGPYK
jgi:hypothetical protein